MKKHSFYIAVSAFLLLASCQKVVDIDLNSKDPQIVIEGNVTDQPGPYTVQITQTVNFDENNTFPAVTGATVTLADDQGNTENLVETSPGIYQSATLQGVAGRTYFLTVISNNKTYTSQSTMPSSIPLDTIVAEDAGGFGADSTFLIIPSFTDPVGMGNYYRCIEYINNERVEGSFLFDDKFTDGIANQQPLFNFSDEVVADDTITVDLQCIDEPTYLYFFSMEQNTNGQTAAPANPVSNISNGALGYFSAHTVSRKTIIVPH